MLHLYEEIMNYVAEAFVKLYKVSAKGHCTESPNRLVISIVIRDLTIKIVVV
jgi:hypothetical protein